MVVLFRIDERLIHGQVVIGWGHELRPDRYLVVDDALADSPWEQELYRLGAGDTEVVFLSAADAVAALDASLADASRTVVLTRDVDTMARLARGGGLAGRTVNFGGLHHGPGRTKVLSYLHLAPSDVEAIRRMVADGVRVQARDLPEATKVDLVEALDLAGR